MMLCSALSVYVTIETVSDHISVEKYSYFGLLVLRFFE